MKLVETTTGVKHCPFAQALSQGLLLSGGAAPLPWYFYAAGDAVIWLKWKIYKDSVISG